jgi:hypothetical protein
MNGTSAPAASAENTAPIQRGRPFAPGQSGNPLGRPRGARNKATIMAEALLDDQAEGIIHKVIEKAMEGDTTALRLCLERLLPPRRDRSVGFELPPIGSAGDVLKASSSILAACADGALSPSEAAEIMDLLSRQIRMLEVTEIEARLTALEKAQRP